MKPIEVLQGKWLGHPLHPAIVHVPIGAWVIVAILDALDRNGARSEAVPHLALYGVIAGLVGGVLAVPTGIAEWASIKKEKPAWKLGLVHMVLNLIAAIVWAANLGLRWKALDSTEPVTTPVLTTSVSGAVLVLISGYIGSLMVFDHGTSVGRQSKRKWRRIAERGGARIPDEKR